MNKMHTKGIGLVLICLSFIIYSFVWSDSEPNYKWRYKLGEPKGKKRNTELSAQGDQNFRYDAGSTYRSTPAVGRDGTIYIGSGDEYLYAINPTGSLKWKFRTNEGIDSSPAIGFDGTIFVGSGDGYLYALNQDGSLKWKFNTEGSLAYITTSPAIGSDGTVYFGSWNGYLYALNNNGTLKWKYETYYSSIYCSSPAIGSDGAIYFGAWEDFYALNSNGTLKWKWDRPYSTGYITSPAIGSDGTLYFGASDSVFALNSNGTIKWHYVTDYTIEFSSPAIGNDNTIYIGSNDNHLYALNPNGTLKWKFQTEDDIKTSPAIGKDGTIYMVSDDLHLYAINPNGSQKWKSNESIGTISSSPTITNDGTIYTGGWYLYAYDSGTGAGLSNAPWPKFGHDVHNTGRYGASIDTLSNESVFEVTLTCGSATSIPSSTVNIPLSLDNSEVALAGGQFKITANQSSFLTFKNITTTSRTTGWTVSYNVSGNGMLILFYSGTGGTISKGNGYFLTVNYEINSAAPYGSEVGLVLSEAQFSDSQQHIVNVNIQNGKITIGGCAISGDVTGDGNVNIFDVLTIVDFILNKQSPLETQMTCADMNSDSSINIFDVLACVDKVLGRNTMLAASEVFTPLPEWELVVQNLKAVQADQSLVGKISQLYEKFQPAISKLPKAISLAQNRPNPFNPSTSVEYTIPEGHGKIVTLKVFDIRGRLVKTLVDGMKYPGSHYVFWNGTDQNDKSVPSGIYLYRLRAGNFTQVRKMVLLK